MQRTKAITRVVSTTERRAPARQLWSVEESWVLEDGKEYDTESTEGHGEHGEEVFNLMVLTWKSFGQSANRVERRAQARHVPPKPTNFSSARAS